MEDEKVDKPQTSEVTESPPAAAELGGPAEVPAAVPPPTGEGASTPSDATAPPAVTDEAPMTPPSPTPEAAAADDTVIVPPAPDAEVGAPAPVAAETAAASTAAAAASTQVSPAKAAAARAPLNRTGRGGTASILAGVAIIAPVLIRELTRGSDPFLLLPISLITLAVALGGLRVAQAGKDGRMGRIGFLLASAGALILTLMLLVIAYNAFVLNTRLQSGVFLLDLGFYALLAGIILFGMAALNTGILARGPMLLFFVAVPIGLALDAAGAFEGNRRFVWGPGLTLGAGLHLGLKIMGLALIWVGYSILKATKASTARAAARAG